MALQINSFTGASYTTTARWLLWAIKVYFIMSRIKSLETDYCEKFWLLAAIAIITTTTSCYSCYHYYHYKLHLLRFDWLHVCVWTKFSIVIVGKLTQQCAAVVGRNVTPAEMAVGVRHKLTSLCDEALAESVALFENCQSMVGIGRFAESRIAEVCKVYSLPLYQMYLMHPSPQNPHANKHWYAIARQRFEELGILTPGQLSRDDTTQTAEGSTSNSSSSDRDSVRRQLFSSP